MSMGYLAKECPECGGMQPGDASGAGDVCTCNVCPSCGYPLPNRAADACGYCDIPEIRTELGFKPLPDSYYPKKAEDKRR